jgi:hypothetical protein
MSYVYFIRNPETGLIKIGISEDPERRISALSTPFSLRLEVIGIVAGGRPLEAILHAELAGSRVRGEWFSPSPIVLAAIEREMAKGVATPQRQQKDQDAFTVECMRWLSCMIEILQDRGVKFRPAMVEIAKRAGMSYGTVFNIRHSRKNSVTVEEYVALKNAYMALLSEEVERVKQVLAETRAMNPRKDYSEVEAHLAAARRALKGGQSDV